MPYCAATFNPGVPTIVTAAPGVIVMFVPSTSAAAMMSLMASASSDEPPRAAQATQATAAQLTTHPDTHIFASLPRVKTLRVARLLAEIGDARGKFPTPQSLAALAGVAPSIRQSGKVKAVTFRWGCNKQLRDALCDFAGGSRHDNPWAADLHNRAIARGHEHPHAVRILGRAWAGVIWRCWHDNLSYDPSQHRALQNTLANNTETAA